MINFKAMGQRIKTLRKVKDYTQESFAEILGVSTEHLSRIETGSYRPSLGLIEKICENLETDEESLMFGKILEHNEDEVLINKIKHLSKEKKEALLIIIDLINS